MFASRAAGFSCIVFVLVMASPTGWAQIVLGTEDLPELTDGSGNVRYSPAYVGARDHEYLDIQLAWLDTDEEAIHTRLNLRVASTNTFEANLRNALIRCQMNATLASSDGEALGGIAWRFNFFNGTVEQQRTNRTMVNSGGIVNSNVTQERTLKTRFDVRYGTPGYFVWTVSTDHLLQYATNLTDLRGQCSEQWGNPASVFSPIQNANDATSKSDYSIPEGRRVAGPDGQPDDIPSLNRRLPAHSSTAVEERERTPDVEAVTVLVALAFIALASTLRGQRRR